jgi:trehalose utilization protein
MARKIKVTVWNEFMHEKQDAAVKSVYPDGIHEAIAAPLRKCKDMEVRTATLDEPEHGLTEEVLADTDVLMWWGHMGHHLVQDQIVQRVQARVLSGMGLIVLHSGHLS